MTPNSYVTSVSDFVDRVMRWTKDGKRPVAFRGQKYHAWRSFPKVFREDVGVYKHEKNIVRDLISVHPQEFSSDSSMFDKLVRMQHFQLPTRLLDVTHNPLVALYFASEECEIEGSVADGKVQAFFVPERRRRYFDSDLVSCMSNMANLTSSEKDSVFDSLNDSISVFNKKKPTLNLLHYIKMEKPHFKGEINPSDLIKPVYVRPKMSNRRIIAQSGAFIIFGAYRYGVKVTDSEMGVKRYLVPHAYKKKIRNELSMLGIYQSSLFPEIDKASEYIVSNYSNSTL
ncbi:FRG domain-containing protein [Oceanibaculum nanhaiense]|uniref:FRG domain-containing protein n=1 Tax=Oceanibaculum nanhaiense TaxID=1909734 RepID=UPI00396E23EB